MLTIPSRHLRIGDFLRFPLGRLGDEQVYRHRWEISAFRTGVVVCRRLADGCIREVSTYWANQYATDPRQTIADEAWDDRRGHRAAGLAAIRARRLGDAKREFFRQHGAETPGHYVTAVKGQQWVRLLGPFVWGETARGFVSPCRRYASDHYADPYCEIAYGVSRVETSAQPGKFNAEILGV